MDLTQNTPKWLRDKHATINPKYNDERCFQCAVTVGLNYEDIRKHSERVSVIRT